MRTDPEHYTQLCREDASNMSDTELQQAILEEVNMVLNPAIFCKYTLGLSKVRIEIYKTALLERKQFISRYESHELSAWA